MALEAQRSLSHYTQPEDYIFCAGNGHALYADDLRKRVLLYPAMDKAGIAREARAYGLHLFRHTAGSEMQEATGDLKKTSSFLGHASTQITGDIYTHGDADQESAEKLEARLFPGAFPRKCNFLLAKPARQ
ncbi:MAG TPA: tyrosine-type recombinase/integrase [Terriglobales bacterium]|nr:tyrosine-type recombinase/integrase [Terriglobales bacterium]